MKFKPILPRARAMRAGFISLNAARRWVIHAPLVSAAAIGLILAIDGPLAWQQRPLLLAGLADETAHLLTAAILLAPIALNLPSAFLRAALAGSVLIDIDHLPLLAGSEVLTRETNRPVTHSLLTIGFLALLVLVPWPRWRWITAGLAAGVAAHLTRDLATTSAGVPLLWPLSDRSFTVPYAVYVTVLIAAAAVYRFRGAYQ
jgi:inner membrane protein